MKAFAFMGYLKKTYEECAAFLLSLWLSMGGAAEHLAD